MRIQPRKLALFAGDIAMFYISLILLMYMRYGDLWGENLSIHIRPFTMVLPVWLLSLFANYLYETRFARFSIDTLRALGTAVAIATVGSISAFYLFPPGLIYPRRNMVLFAGIYALSEIVWRWLYYKGLKGKIKTNVFFIGDGREVEELKKYFKENPHLGYETVGEADGPTDNINELIQHIEFGEARLVAIKTDGNEKLSKALFPLLATDATIIDLEEFYERTLRKVSPEILNDMWFIKSLENINLDVYRVVKRAADIIIGIAGSVVFLAAFPIIGFAIRTTSSGPILFKQARTGAKNTPFYIYKFRTMRAIGADGSAETDGPKWAVANDDRVTSVGRVLRKTRMDELPQFWNILKGEMSIVGPRPERPEFVSMLSEEIPYYNMRHLVKPGLTGWAQINYEYGDSIDDARIKLQYDIYYAKKRSIALDLAILLKTIKIVLTRQGQ